ncbi:hypothetical protein N1851_008491 [Merluccius polli]|uniref:Uncharacterized protein n=1 Tax=Merluccius polli TaxID=89951 RepID=A0AA47P4J2_MERPO|nr:hypothetical protein N1851_008491 [Merluccius polli]
MWFSSATYHGNSEELKRRWVSILHHVLDIHTWTEGEQEYHCLHGPLTLQQRRKKFVPLRCITAPLLKYAPKRQTFSYMGMKEQGQLTILEHNENIVKRQQATTSTRYYICIRHN